MKILVISDLHWLDVWKKHIEDNPYADKIVFLWDYVDSFNVSDEDMIRNLKEIIAFKRENKDKVVLLLWNHDVQYFWHWCRCSWYRPRIANELEDIFIDAHNDRLFKMFYSEWDYLFSHAGITNEWIKYNFDKIELYFIDWYYKYTNLNNILFTTDEHIFTQCWPERGGRDRVSWPLWANKSDTTNNGVLDWFTQVVGHTQISGIIKLPHIIYCDTLVSWSWQPLLLTT